MAVNLSFRLTQVPALGLTTNCTCTSNPGPSRAYPAPGFTSWAIAFSRVPSQPAGSSLCHSSKGLACASVDVEGGCWDIGTHTGAGRTRRKTLGPLRAAKIVSEVREVSQESGLESKEIGQINGNARTNGSAKSSGNGKSNENGEINGSEKSNGNGKSNESGAINGSEKTNENGERNENGKEFDGVVRRQGRSKFQRVEWWRIDERGGLQTSSESPSQTRENAAAVERVAGPRGRTVGWMREAHGEESDGEELWTWKASTQTLHLNGNVVHKRLEGGSNWVEEETVEASVEVSENGAVAGGYLRESLCVGSVDEGVSVTAGSENGVASSRSSTESSQNGVGELLRGVSVNEGSVNGAYRGENGHGAARVEPENGRLKQGYSENGRPHSSETAMAEAAVLTESEVGRKSKEVERKFKKDEKRKKKGGAAKLKEKKNKSDKKKDKKEASAVRESERRQSVESHIVDENGARVRMYPGPGYVDRMQGQKLDILSSPTDTVQHRKDKLSSGGVKTGGEARPSADSLEERLQDLRRKAIEHKDRHARESGTLVVPKTRQPILVLMRHGQSMWNELKLFTGDVDIPLTEKGAMEALSGGRTIKDVDFDIVFTSRLLRAKQTAMLALTQNSSHVVPVLVRGGYHGEGRIGDGNRLRLREAATYALDKAACKMVPVYAHPALNERCYGDLQGLNKEEAAKEFGKEMVQKWRRSNDTSPPGGESLVDTAQRARKYYVNVIEPRLAEGKNVLVVTHGNVMRGLIAYLASLEQEEMLTLEIATAFPYAYAFSRESGDYAQCCLMKPMEDFITGEPLEDKPMGLASVLKKKNFDSLI